RVATMLDKLIIGQKYNSHQRRTRRGIYLQGISSQLLLSTEYSSQRRRHHYAQIQIFQS
ncbi:hypothetical protein ACJMK2_001554, partial [Sinanodonta woodiana]